MSHDLLGDVLRSDDETGRLRRRVVLPLSIAAHGAAVAAILIIPLAAEVELPEPARISNPYAHIMPASVPDVPQPTGTPAPGVQPAAAPTRAPEAIADEVQTPAQPAGPRVPLIVGPIGVPDGLEIGQVGTPAAVTTIPPPVPAPEPIRRVGGDIREPRKIVDVAPIYPPIAVAARKEGVVILEAVIDERGRVVRLKVLRSEPMLDQAAIQAVERWRYTPTLLNNVPVPVLMTITVSFRLR